MGRTHTSKLLLLGALLLVASLSLLSGCAGVSAGTRSQLATNPGSGSLAVSPSSLNFGNVAVGASSSLKASLTASNADVTVASAAWNGSGYSVSGISFPVTISAGQSAIYTVTFTPVSAGTSPGAVSFTSDANNSSLQQSFSGNGTQTSGAPNVGLSWNPSSSTVIGYNIYRGTQSGGPYSKLNLLALSGTTYTDSSVQSGKTYFYVSTAVNSSSAESSYSNEATATIP